MKALVLKEYHKFSYEDVPVPAIGSEDVLIEVRGCGICGSDVHGMDGSTGRRQPPIIMGHEAAGIVMEAGSAVSGWRKGDRVTFDSTIYCGKCAFCRQGRINLCDHRRVLGVSCDDYRRHGAFAEFVAVPQHILYRLPEGVPFERAAMVEALSIAFHAVRQTPVTLNDSAVIFGAGMIGLLLIQTLRISGCGWIAAVDVESERLDLARKLGADHTINSAATGPVAELHRLTGGMGVDLAFEVVGIASTVDAAVRSVRKGGAVTLIGNISPSIQFPLQVAVTRELSVHGSCASSGEYPACLDMLARGVMNIAPLISAVAPLSEGASWFERLYRKEKGLFKVILSPEGKA